jgi:hypothetical protein
MAGKKSELEFHSDRWQRFERAAAILGHSQPMHQVKPSGKRKATPKRKPRKKPGP